MWTWPISGPTETPSCGSRRWTWAFPARFAGCCRESFRPMRFAACRRKLPQRTIRWEFVNLIEPDPLRRVKLRLSSERLAELHPADIADIMEELVSRRAPIDRCHP